MQLWLVQDHTYQGRKKCGGSTQKQTCTAQAGQTRRSQSQVEHHSATDTTIASGENAHGHPSHQAPEQLQPTPQAEHQAGKPTRGLPRKERQTKKPSREPAVGSAEKLVQKPKIRWPKASNKDGWISFDGTLHTVLRGTLKGNKTSKLNIIGHIIYEEGSGRFGGMHRKNTTPGKWGDGKERSPSW